MNWRSLRCLNLISNLSCKELAIFLLIHERISRTITILCSEMSQHRLNATLAVKYGFRERMWMISIQVADDGLVMLFINEETSKWAKISLKFSALYINLNLSHQLKPNCWNGIQTKYPQTYLEINQPKIYWKR